MSTTTSARFAVASRWRSLFCALALGAAAAQAIVRPHRGQLSPVTRCARRRRDGRGGRDGRRRRQRGAIAAAACTTVMVGNVAYQHCGNTWYQPHYAGSQVTYVVVNPPR